MLPLIPYPQHIEEKSGELSLSLPLVLAIQGKIQLPIGLLQSHLPDLIYTPKTENANILLILDEADNEEELENYELSITSEKIILRASHETGLFYGIQTLRQLLPANPKTSITLPCLEIKDFPAYAWRGFMLDEARHFFGIESVKHLLDWLAFFKINRFHWHLTDDQGWRIENKTYPGLTEIGSRRTGSKHKNRFSKDWDRHPHQGYYTQYQIQEIVAYATERSITVIPEFDLPGHFSAVLAAYPEFGCTKESIKVQNNWGIFKEVACVGSPQTREFLKTVLDEWCQLFPGQYIHLGGDEVKYDHWRNCPLCQAEIKHRNYSKVEQLHSFIMNELAEYLLQQGKTPIVWNEALQPGLNKEVIVMHWTPGKRQLQKTRQALAEGRQVILQPFLETYFDYSHTLIPLKKVMEMKTLTELTPAMRENVLGVQGCLWTEFVEDEKRIQFQSFPRQAAVAENGWSGRSPSSRSKLEHRWFKLISHLHKMEMNHPAPLSAVNPGPFQRIQHTLGDFFFDMQAEQKRYHKR